MAIEQRWSVSLWKNLSSSPSGHASAEAATVECHWMIHERKTAINYRDFRICSVIKAYGSLFKNISILPKEQHSDLTEH